MKIVFLAPFGIRPKGTVIARMLPLAAELQKLGHMVTIVAPPYTNPDDSGRTETVHGVRLVNVTLPSVGKVLGALPLAWRMFLAARDEKPELLHLFKPKGYGGLAAMLHITLQRLGIRLAPLFVDTDDWEGQGGMNELHAYSNLEKRLFAFQEQWLSQHAVGVSAASRTLETLTNEMGVAAERILYLPNCVEASASGDGMLVREKLGLDATTPVVLLYTRFFEFSQKRLYHVFSEICRRVPGVRFLVVGKGRNREEESLIRTGQEQGFGEALLMAGWLEPLEIKNYLAAADVAVYPLDDTLINCAKCPAKLTELLVAGVPVVADRVGQAAEYIRPQLTGILCNPESPGEMVEETVGLLRNQQRRQSLGEAGKTRLLEYFNWRTAAARLDQFYLNLVKL